MSGMAEVPAESTAKTMASPVPESSPKDGTVLEETIPVAKPVATPLTATVTTQASSNTGSVEPKPVAQAPPQAPTRPDASDPPPYTQRQLFIAVMGKTGTGKTTFINQISGKNLEVGHGLQSCTENIGFAPANINGEEVTFIDTPGFDDSDRDDGEILALIGTWLKTAHDNNQLLSGVIYLHNITDIRMGLSSLRSLATLKNMCGTENYSNICLVTTMWDTVDIATGEQREQELKVGLDYWAKMVKDGAKVFRHNRNKESAEEIVMNLLPKRPIVLDIQTQMASNEGIIGKTTAGSYIKQFLEDRQMEYTKKITNLANQMAELQLERDLERGEFELMKARWKQDVDKMAQDIELLMTKVDVFVGGAKADGPIVKKHPTFARKLLGMLSRMEKK